MTRMPEFVADPFDRLAPRDDGPIDQAPNDEFRILASGPELWIALRRGADGLGRDLLRFHPGTLSSAATSEMPATEVLDLVRRSGRSGSLRSGGRAAGIAPH